MKKLKMYFSSLLLFLILCQFIQVQPLHSQTQVTQQQMPVLRKQGPHTHKTVLPVYREVIGNISLSYDEAMLAGNIKLASGLIMRITDYKTRDDNVINTWRSGDKIVFRAQVKGDALVLSATRLGGPDEEKVEPYVMFDVINSPKKAGLTIEEINDHGKFVRLSDNSVWRFSWYNYLSTRHWKVGERVIVFGLGDKNSYDFINLDAPVTLNVAAATGTFVIN